MIWNTVKASAAPYTLLIKVGAAVLVASVLFVGGCNYGKSNQAATVVDLQHNLDTALAANKRYEDLNAERKRLDELAAKETARQEAAALKAADRTGKVQEQQQAVEDRNNEALTRAMRDPKCDELMRMQVCSIVPLP